MIYIESLPFSSVISYAPNWVMEHAAAMGSSEGQVTSWCDTCFSSELECKRMCLADDVSVYNYLGKSCQCYSMVALTFTPSDSIVMAFTPSDSIVRVNFEQRHLQSEALGVCYQECGHWRELRR